MGLSEFDCEIESDVVSPKEVGRTTVTLLAFKQDNIHVSVSPAARSLVDYVRQAMKHLTSPAYHCNSIPSPVHPTDLAPAPLEVAATQEQDQEISLLCSSVILCPSRTDVSFLLL